MKRRKLPVGIQSFQDIRQKGFVYVDKTEYIWNLVESTKTYFLSRPRRFGKSLFVSTLASYFSGKKELFEGLYISEKENEHGKDAWAEYPVITFYLSGGNYDAPNGLSDNLNYILNDCARKYGLSPEAIAGETLPVRFRNIIQQLNEKTGRQVVVLVDEYDKPLLSTMLTNQEQEEKNRELYKGFFSVLKDMDDYLKFVFFTGVTKFTKVSIFSDLNQLNDISMDDDFSGICGITENELQDIFQPEIKSLAEAEDMTYDECQAELQKMYDGYHFSKNGVGVYNPYSLLSAFMKNNFNRYWFGTATPEILVKKLQESPLHLSQITDGVEATADELQDYRVEDPNPVPLFYQTGYLTITGFDRSFGLYSLKFPNDEVKYGFLNSLIPFILGSASADNPISLRLMLQDLMKGQPDSFIKRLTALFASIPYPEGKAPEYEGEWSRQIFLILELMGAYTQCEVHMATGRADCVVKTNGFIYVFEFKLDKPVNDAMAQIDDKGYTIPYTADSRKLYKIGVVFSAEKRNVVDWKIASDQAAGRRFK